MDMHLYAAVIALFICKIYLMTLLKAFMITFIAQVFNKCIWNPWTISSLSSFCFLQGIFFTCLPYIKNLAPNWWFRQSTDNRLHGYCMDKIEKVSSISTHKQPFKRKCGCKWGTCYWKDCRGISCFQHFDSITLNTMKH